VRKIPGQCGQLYELCGHRGKTGRAGLPGRFDVQCSENKLCGRASNAGDLY